MTVRTFRRLVLCTSSLVFLSPLTVLPSYADTTTPAAAVEEVISIGNPEIITENGVSSFTLPNGLDVIVIPDHRAPVVTHMLWYRVGAADEQDLKTGLAHFLEHLMFKGTKDHPEGEFSKRIAEIGGQENAFTSYDYTAYYQRVSPDALPMVMEFEADRMTNLVLDEAEVNTERDVIIEERRMRIDNNPGAILGENTNPVLYFNHPYRRPVIGWRQDMESLNRDDALAFYKKFYKPNNATLVVAGDVTPEKVLELTKENYALIPRGEEPEIRNRPQEPEKNTAREVRLHDPRVSQPSYTMRWLTPSYNNESRFPNAKEGDAAALDLLGEILGGSMRSRLYQELIVKDGIAGSAAAGFYGDAYDDGTFSVYGSPSGDATLGEVKKRIEQEINKITTEGVSETELNQARNRFLKDIIFARDSQYGMASIFGSAAAVGQSVEDVNKMPEQLKAVTVDQIKDVASRYLNMDRAVTSYLLPPDMEPETARIVGDGVGSATPEMNDMDEAPVQDNSANAK